ncbi:MULTISPECIES: YbaL family putative K(+) efflux transporter [Methylobacterium]|uniref:YbaL family putative K(+) efflux transporter n=2 Tax=Methylobacteriaceae TaxID=119045 RepID=UPI0006F9954E|nr:MULTISPECIES: YbaL family putative K(+) efflux transporter [Methylobacterium]KQS61594.1 sodium:proton antiporter [Methylobacterium sp. Leaf361]MBN4095590.1 Kef family K(+) transporter [Methylobacterium sp. OT2]UIN37354.1 Kef family K(+) transporter [Methylobacterium oryzae]SEF98023.1 Kef-type potassium/proton antiporter, CPA2 family [Methylobacterium sp. 190mf]SFD62272.1 Kef-type potassium/proton antiporter, CPA2 family [Methylobacterium sp. 13MFTsu3.1M2]
MPHATELIAIIALGLTLAFICGMVAQRLRLPPLVGYLVAGVLVGPYTPGFVGDSNLTGQLAEIGVILLMFGVGLHFSFKDLMAVRAIALPGAVVQIAAATAMGIGLAFAWGWTLGQGLVFGLALSVASTVVLLRALEERGLLDTDNGRIAVGWLIVEDLAMVLTLVVLPALAPSLGGEARGLGHGTAHALTDLVAQLVGPEYAQSLALTVVLTLAKVAVFAGLMLVGGRRFVPWLLDQAARTGSRELFTLAVLALALGIAFGSAELFGVSFALGAFFAGMVLAESDLSHQAAADSLPLQDAFAVLFFVSVGMLFDPGILLRAPLSVLAVLGVIMVGKSLAAVAIVLAFRHPLGTALTIAASLAQIGEFSFILVSLGLSLKLLPEEGRNLILGGALLSITLNPLFFALAARIEQVFADRPDLAARFARKGAADVAISGGEPPRRDHVVIIGFGRVGSSIGATLETWDLPYVVVERDRRRVLALRAAGTQAVFGDATAPGILEAAGIGTARLLVVATPDAHQARRLVEAARAANPGIDTVVRTHSEAERRHLEEDGVGLVLMGERELALGMSFYALRSLGVREGEARVFIDTARAESRSDAEVTVGPVKGTPELRHQHDRDGADLS